MPKGSSAKSVYLIGIKGVGMTALALYFLEAGYEVIGSDVGETFVTDQLLQKAGILVLNGFESRNLRGQKPDLVVASAVYGNDNSEIKEAKRRHLNLKYYSEVLGQITEGKKVIACAGTHGKTTITALTSYLLEKANLSPSFIIGAGKIPDLKTAQKGDGDYFIIEADEYRKSPDDSTPKFLDINPFIVVISSIELDHPDVFSSIEEMYDVFYRLSCRVPRNGFIILCADYAKSKKLVQSLVDRRFETYGFDLNAKWRIVNLEEKPETTTFNLSTGEETYGPFAIKLPGRYNVLNATAAIITAIKLDVSEKTIKKYLIKFSGVKRRYEKIAQFDNIIIIDDYAHHPTAISNVLSATKTKYPGSQVWCIFQPHTYSRTKRFLDDFANSFGNADKVIITDIFASAREKEGKISGLDLANEIKKHQKGVKYINNWDKIREYITDSISSPAVILTMGAGDIYKLAISLKEIMYQEKGYKND